MVTFLDYLLEQYLIEKSLYKVDALLRADPSAGLQPGYASIAPFLGPRASQQVVNVAMDVLDRVNRHDPTLSISAPTWVSLKDLAPTQHAVYLDDVKDIARKGGTDKPVHVLSHNGHLYILNGHHRVSAAALLNRPGIQAHIVRA